MDNFIGFLTIGIFIFSFIASTTTAGAKAITSNQSLVRSIRFPRAALPVSVALAEFLTLLPAVVVMLVIVVVTGEPLTWRLALLPVTLVLLLTFCTGVALLAARVVAGWRDAANFIPVGVRLLRYASGVFFSITAYAGMGAIGQIMLYQPVSVYLELVRACLLQESTQNPTMWVFAVAWAVVFATGGMVLFYRAEQSYGRV